MPHKSKLRNAVEYLPGRLEALNMLTEQATRFAEFKAVLEKEKRTRATLLGELSKKLNAQRKEIGNLQQTDIRIGIRFPAVP